MTLNLTRSQTVTKGSPAAILESVRAALGKEGYIWEKTGPTSAIASKLGTSDPDRRAAGSARTQIEIELDGNILKTRRLSRGHHKGFVGVVQVQQDHRRGAKAIRKELSSAGLLAE